MSAAVLIVSHPDDMHAREVVAHLAQRAVTPVILDTGRIPRAAQLTIDHACEQGWGGELIIDDQPLDLSGVRSVWWRRPRPFTLHEDLAGGDDRGFALSETHAAVSGLWSLLDAKWINEPDRDERAARKAWQLKAARQVGLNIPRTCITNSPERARAFVSAEPGKVIYKAFSATERTWRETRVLRAEETSLLDAVRYAPVIFQEYVPAKVDLRVTIVGEAIFAAEIDSQATSYPYDFRMDMSSAAVQAHQLPAEIEAQLHALMAKLGLSYGAIDMRLTPDGRYVFLEVNPAGQWLFIEQRTGQPISAAVAALIASNAQA